MPAEDYTYQGFTIHARTGVIPDDDRGIVQEVVKDYFWERLPENVRTAIDIGAHIGSWSCYLARRYPEAQIAAIEPNPDNFAMLAHNARQYPGIKVYPGAVTTYAQPRLLVDDTNSGGHRVVNGTADGKPVMGISLMALIHMAGEVDVLKIDCEGCEYDILTPGPFWEKVRCVVGEYHSSQATFEARIGAWLRGRFTLEVYPVLPWDQRGLFFAQR